jgi:hypothetical protein
MLKSRLPLHGIARQSSFIAASDVAHTGTALGFLMERSGLGYRDAVAAAGPVSGGDRLCRMKRARIGRCKTWFA